MTPYCAATCLLPGGPPCCNGCRCLVAAATAGDTIARESVFTLLYPQVLRQTRRLCRRPFDAEDLAQTALLQAFQRLHQLRDCHKLLAWVWRIARNAWLMDQRAARRDSGVSELQENAVVPGAGSFAGQEEQFRYSETHEAALKALAELPPSLGAVFQLRVEQGKSTAETAQRLGISNEAVRTRLTRARRRIAAGLAGRTRLPSRQGYALHPHI